MIIIATASWDWEHFAALSLLIIITALLVMLRSVKINDFFLPPLVFLLIAYVYHGYMYPDYYPVSPCPKLLTVGLGLFSSIGLLVCSLRLIGTRIWWVIFIPIAWLVYYTPEATSNLTGLWHHAAEERARGQR